MTEMGSPEDFEDWAHLGPSGRGLRSRGRRGRRGGEEEEEKEDQGREGNKQPGLVIQGKVHIKLEITDRRTK